MKTINRIYEDRLKSLSFNSNDDKIIARKETKIYIIADYYNNTIRNHYRYALARERLLKMGLTVTNPEIGLNHLYKTIDYKRKLNISALLSADTIYLMADVPINTDNIELKMVLHLNLTIIHESMICVD